MSPHGPAPMPRRRRTGRLTRALSFLAACAFTAALFWYLSAHTSLADWRALAAGLDWPLMLAYLALFLGAVGLRARRYQVLLRASDPQQAPGLADLAGLTLVSNLFVDLLPARSGSLAYVVFLNQKLQVRLAACVSSLAFAVIFDLLAMAPLILLAILSAWWKTGAAGPWLWLLLGLLAGLGLAVLAWVDRILAWAAGWARGWLAGRGGWLGRLERVAGEALAVARDMAAVKAKGVFWPVLVLSVLIRLAKYGGLYLLVLAVAGQWGQAVTANLSFALVLFALVAAEASASLPISGLAGFGAYEGVMMLTLRSAGLEPTQAALLPVTVHVITQAIDYSLGSLALMRLSLKQRRRPVNQR
ncbi:MAG: lysylphosphatidylglycerol synthase transmembrane domain-containing protein [Pseudomonadota bacterium]